MYKILSDSGPRAKEDFTYGRDPAPHTSAPRRSIIATLRERFYVSGILETWKFPVLILCLNF